MLSLTDAATKRVKDLIIGRGTPEAGIRLSVRSKGCSGLSYCLEFADRPADGDEVVKVGDIRLFIDPKAVFFIIGSQMDYREDALESGFVFSNPNEKGRCGCGESFHV